MAELFFSRVRLSDSQGVRAIVQMLRPEGDEQRTVAAHRLLWMLFAENEGTKRDFLWREIDSTGYAKSYYVLSSRPPVDQHRMFNVETRPYVLDVPERTDLAFDLRVNPTLVRTVNGKKTRHDIVMDALSKVPAGPDRAGKREAIAQEAGAAWLAAKGESCGFKLRSDALVENYRSLRLGKREHGKPMSFGVLDVKGTIRVTDPALFAQSVAAGFGRAKSYGMGLMLLRRG